MSMASCTSPRVSARTLPISRVMSLENSSLRWRRSSAARNRISARFGAGTSRHDLYASFAASTAAFTSSSVEDTNIPINSSVFAGLRFSYTFPLRDSTHSPLMKFLNIRGATAVAILPPQSLKLAALLFVWSSAGLHANLCRVETKFYRRPSTGSNFDVFWHFPRWSELTPAIPGESLALQRPSNGCYESTPLQRLTCVLPRRGVPLPNRSHGRLTHPPVQAQRLAGLRGLWEKPPTGLIFLIHHYRSALHYPFHFIEYNVDVSQGITVHGHDIRKIARRHRTSLLLFPQQLRGIGRR